MQMRHKIFVIILTKMGWQLYKQRSNVAENVAEKIVKIVKFCCLDSFSYLLWSSEDDVDWAPDVVLEAGAAHLSNLSSQTISYISYKQATPVIAKKKKPRK